MLHRIHVNTNRIRQNIHREAADREPVLTARRYTRRGVRTPREVKYGNRIEILDAEGRVVATFVYDPDNPLPCGARVWVETLNAVNVK